VASVLGFVIFVGSIFLVPLLPSGFQPAGDPDFLFVSIQGPPGATAADMEDTVQRVTAALKTRPEVQDVFAEVGSSGPANPFAGGGGGGDLRSASLNVLLDPERKTSGDEIRAALRPKLRDIPDARVNFLNFQGTAGYQQILTSEDPAKLQAASVELEREMRTLDVLAEPRPSVPPTGPELVIRPRAAEASRLGVSADVIAQAARVATVGDIDANVAKLTSGERRIPVRIRLPAGARADLDRIKSTASASRRCKPS